MKPTHPLGSGTKFSLHIHEYESAAVSETLQRAIQKASD
jgi:hypothetical protein